MTTQVPSPFESTNEESSFFNELIADTRPSSTPATSFPSTGFSADAVLGMFRNETNAMLAGEVSKMKTQERNVFETRFFGWKEQLDGAIGKIEEKIQVLADVQTPQKRDAKRRSDEEQRRPLAYALLRAIKQDLIRQTHALELVEQELISQKLLETHEEALIKTQTLAASAKETDSVKHALNTLFRNIFKSVHESYGAKGFEALAPFIQKLQSSFPKEHEALFFEQFLASFQETEQVGLFIKKPEDFASLMHLHSRIHDKFSPHGKGIVMSFFDAEGVQLQYMRGLADVSQKRAFTEKTPLPFGAFSKQLVALSLALLADEKKLILQDNFQKYFPSLEEIVFTYQNVPKTISLNDLLFMKSGLIDVQAYLTLMGKNPNAMPIEQQILLLKQHPELIFEPGQDMQDNMINYLLLIKAIEKASGMPYRDFVQKHILSKAALDMPNSHFVGDLELTSTFGDAIKLEQNMLENKLGKNPEKIGAMLTEHVLEEAVGETLATTLSVFSQEGGQALMQTSRMSGFSLLFLAFLSQAKEAHGFLMASINEDVAPHPFVQTLVNDPQLQPLFGLAFVPFILQEELAEEKPPADDETLMKLLQKFEGVYRAESHMFTWQIRCKKELLDFDQKEHVGLEAQTPELLFFVPTYADENHAHVVLAKRATCRLEFSENKFLLQDPASGLRDVLFEKV